VYRTEGQEDVRFHIENMAIKYPELSKMIQDFVDPVIKDVQRRHPRLTVKKVSKLVVYCLTILALICFRSLAC